ncbi:hypothetical protein EVAR_33377_1 [Eumeta japonica]|uniref:Uncharacterized protein n=1 Tax=Eumeta variegata TaxID=151549 RepID=A0A4C1X455_EUMVA|nr:hypothetical protein EVAR_33377_1 [Eumeta japonica]
MLSSSREPASALAVCFGSGSVSKNELCSFGAKLSYWRRRRRGVSGSGAYSSAMYVILKSAATSAVHGRSVPTLGLLPEKPTAALASHVASPTASPLTFYSSVACS